jgi:hypothetical protein
MAWTKLDDDAVAADQPLSAFVGNRLTANVNTYIKELQRSATFAYPTTGEGAAKVKWASIFGRRGTVITVDCGRDASDFVFKVFYKTTNAAIGGTLYVRDIDAGNTVSVAVPGSASPTSIEVPFLTYGVRGLRGFHISFESDVSEESVGRVQPIGSVGNQVFCEPATGNPFPFTYAAGTYAEMYHLLKIDPLVTRPAPAAGALLNYQICAFKHNSSVNHPPHGVLLIWPELEIQPAILPTDSSASGGSQKFDANIYELGRIELFSITVEMSWPTNNNILPPYVYEQPTPLTQLNNYIDSNMRNLQPDAATNISTGGFLGCVLPAGEEATFAFFVQTFKSVQQLDVSFRAVAYNQAQDVPDITFGVRDCFGDTIGTDIVRESVPVPRITAQTTMEPQDGAAVFMNGVLAGDELWGMRDAMDLDNALMGMPIRFTWGPNGSGDIAQGSNGTTDAVYYGTITATSDLYIYGFNCRVL